MSDRQHRGGGLTAFGESLDGQTGVEEGVEERGQWEVGGAHLVAYSLVGPGRLGPVAVGVAGADQDRGRVAAVGETAQK
jgi:hypothetical protein